MLGHLGPLSVLDESGSGIAFDFRDGRVWFFIIHALRIDGWNSLKGQTKTATMPNSILSKGNTRYHPI